MRKMSLSFESFYFFLASASPYMYRCVYTQASFEALVKRNILEAVANRGDSCSCCVYVFDKCVYSVRYLFCPLNLFRSSTFCWAEWIRTCARKKERNRRKSERESERQGKRMIENEAKKMEGEGG